MSISILTEAEAERALQIWEQYQQTHDLSSRQGQAAGIEPVSGRIWFGESAVDVQRQMSAEGIDLPFFCARIGSQAYLVKRTVQLDRVG